MVCFAYAADYNHAGKYLVRNRPLRELDVKASSIKLVFELDNVRVFFYRIDMCISYIHSFQMWIAYVTFG